jgi:ribosomal protein S18 acetylase RimI-like enzyme
LLVGLPFLEKKPNRGECYIEHIAVRTDAQGEGVGTKLLNFGKEFAVQNGFKEYTLDVASSNEGAVKL